MSRLKRVAGAILLAVASDWACASGTAIAKLPGGLVLQIIDHAVTCNGGPTALLLDAQGRNKDQTCNVHITPDGVRTLFASYGKPIFWQKEQFSVLDDPSIPSKRVKSLMDKADALNDVCRDGVGDTHATDAVCERRDRAYAQTKQAGWCWGHANDIGADRRWVPCLPGD